MEPEDGHKHLVFLTAVESRASIEIVYQLLLLFKEDLIPGYWFEVVVFEGKESLVGLMRDFCPQMAIVDAEIVFESRSEIGSGIEAIAQLRKNYPQLPIMVMTTEKRGSEKVDAINDKNTFIFGKMEGEQFSGYLSIKWAVAHLLEKLNIPHNLVPD